MRLITGCIVVATMGIVFIGLESRGVSSRLEGYVAGGRRVFEKSAKWTSGGVEIRLTLRKSDTETDDEFCDRFLAAVKATKVDFPPDQ